MCFALAALAVTGILTGCAATFPPYRLPASRDCALSQEAKSVVLENFSSENRTEERRFRVMPRRVIAVGEAAAETLLALGQGERLAAIVDVVENGAELEERFPGFNADGHCKVLNRPSVETLVMLRPDLLVGWASSFTMKRYGSTGFWSERGADVYLAASSMPIFPVKTADMELKYILDMGRIFCRYKEAERIVAGLRKEISDAARSHAENPPRVMVLALSRSLIINYGTGSLPGNIVELSGGRMVASGRYLSAEEVIQLNPDVIFVVRLDRRLDAGVRALADDPKFRTLDCVANGNVYGIPVHWVYNSGINVGNAIDLMTRCLARSGGTRTVPRWEVAE